MAPHTNKHRGAGQKNIPSEDLPNAPWEPREGTKVSKGQAFESLLLRFLCPLWIETGMENAGNGCKPTRVIKIRLSLVARFAWTNLGQAQGLLLQRPGPFYRTHRRRTALHKKTGDGLRPQRQTAGSAQTIGDGARSLRGRTGTPTKKPGGLRHPRKNDRNSQKLTLSGDSMDRASPPPTLGTKKFPAPRCSRAPGIGRSSVTEKT